MADGTGAGRTAAVVFDIDGTLLDSAAGIVAGFEHALASVGFLSPGTVRLRSDLGPPVEDQFTALGVGADVLKAAVTEYRRWYLRHGIQQAWPYLGKR